MHSPVQSMSGQRVESQSDYCPVQPERRNQHSRAGTLKSLLFAAGLLYALPPLAFSLSPLYS